MTNLFDKNGNATETHTVTVSGFDSITGEFVNTYDVRIFAGTGIPGFSTLTLAPAADAGHVVCWNGSEWQQVIDLRGSTAYETATGDAVVVKELGPLADELTSVVPNTPYDSWDGTKWVTDTEIAKKVAIEKEEQQRSVLLFSTNNYISDRQWPGKAAIGRLKGDELTQYNLWLDYLDALYAVDTSTAPDIDWPQPPA